MSEVAGVATLGNDPLCRASVPSKCRAQVGRGECTKVPKEDAMCALSSFIRTYVQAKLNADEGVRWVE